MRGYRITWKGQTPDLTVAKLAALHARLQELGFTAVNTGRWVFPLGIAAAAAYEQAVFSLLYAGGTCYIMGLIRANVDRAQLYVAIRDHLGLTNEQEIADEAEL